jgi:uncharacterized hydrophobic protein (TIGR00271 family)
MENHFVKKWWRFIRQSVTIHGGTDVGGTIAEVRSNVAVRGANIWMLVCSSLLASIGLDLNSTAVIIGAMLISPLMSPILGVGLGVAIFDRALLRTAFGNLMLATFISLTTSFIYFSLTPLGELTTELQARTTPTILDVGVAFFGGVAGIVAGSRKNKTSAIPGVAIATALMPPLCTAGFGLASGDYTIFLGAFYLYFINATFISLSTYLIALWLKFPRRAELGEEQNTMVKRFIVAAAIVVMLPSAYIFYGVIHRLRVDRGVKNFVNAEVRRDDRLPIRWDIEGKPDSGTLKVYCVGSGGEDAEVVELQNNMPKYGLTGLELKLISMNVPRGEFRRLASTIDSDVSGQIKLLTKVDETRQAELIDLRQELDKLREKVNGEGDFLTKVRTNFESIESVEWQKPATEATIETSNFQRTMVIKFKPETSARTIRTVKAEIAKTAEYRWPFEKFAIVDAPPEIENEDVPQDQ